MQESWGEGGREEGRWEEEGGGEGRWGEVGGRKGVVVGVFA